MVKTFKTMSRDERAEVVRVDMAAGGSYNKLATKYTVSVGHIAGICRDYDIPSTHAPPDMGRAKKKPAKKPRAPKLPAPKPVAPKAHKPKPAPPPKQDIAGLEEAKSEASRCESLRTHCLYEAKVGSRFCPLHQDEESGARH